MVLISRRSKISFLLYQSTQIELNKRTAKEKKILVILKQLILPHCVKYL